MGLSSVYMRVGRVRRAFTISFSSSQEVSVSRLPVQMLDFVVYGLFQLILSIDFSLLKDWLF